MAIQDCKSLFSLVALSYHIQSRFAMYKPLIRQAGKQLRASARPIAGRGYASMNATPQPFNWQDPLAAQTLFTEEEIAISETAEAYCQERMLPRVLGKLNGSNATTSSADCSIRCLSRRTL